MTLGELIEDSRRKSRVHQAEASNQVIAGYLNAGIMRFSEAVGGVLREDILYPLPRFVVHENHAVALTTDTHSRVNIALTSEASRGIGAQELAHAIQTSFRHATSDTDITVSWDWDAMSFSFTFPNNTTISIDAPDAPYLDGTLFLGGIWQVSSPTHTPKRYCGYVMEAMLPQEFIAPLKVSWDQRILKPMPINVIASQSVGIPVVFAIRDKRIRISPSPRVTHTLRLMYSGFYDLFDLSEDVDPEEGDPVPLDLNQICSLPHEHHTAISYYAAAKIAENRFEEDIAAQRMKSYQQHVSDYRINFGNDNTAIGFYPQSRPTRLRNEPVDMG